MTVKSVVVLVMLWVSLRNNFAAFLSLQALPFKLAINDGLSLYASVMRNFVILFIFFALIDVPLAKPCSPRAEDDQTGAERRVQKSGR